MGDMPNQKLRAGGRCHDGQNRYTKYLAATSIDPNADVRVPTGDVAIRLPWTRNVALRLQ